MTTEQFLRRNDFVIDYRRSLPRHDVRTWRKRQLSDLRGLVWHQSLSSASAAAVARYHVGPNHISQSGLPAISYTFFVDRAGDVLLCNDLEDITYSQGDRTKPGDENRIYLAACFGGNFDAPGYDGSDYVQPKQMLAGLKLWLACQETFGWTDDCLHGHYHFGKAACPGTTLAILIEEIRAVAALASKRYDLDTFEGRQGALQLLGHYTGIVDGIWGMRSREALIAYQRDVGLTVDGIWGPESAYALDRDANS